MDLVKKLRLLSARRPLVLNPPEGYLELFSAQPGVEVPATQPEGQHDWVQFFARSRDDLAAWAPVAPASVTHDGVLWACFPKKSAGLRTDLDRDHGWELLAGAGLRPVTQVAIDETWSALRFRPTERVGR